LAIPTKQCWSNQGLPKKVTPVWRPTLAQGCGGSGEAHTRASRGEERHPARVALTGDTGIRQSEGMDIKAISGALMPEMHRIFADRSTRASGEAFDEVDWNRLLAKLPSE
jgi:hypothetical protein